VKNEMMMKRYNHLFFDLDRTLWDFDRNAEETFWEMYERFDLKGFGIHDFDKFYAAYKEINIKLWDLYRDGEITKEILRDKRFNDTLMRFGVENRELAEEISDYYITQSPLKNHLFPFTIELLDSLKGKFTMHIITNGFEEVQTVKLDNSDLRKYFDKVITSEQVGVKKPFDKVITSEQVGVKKPDPAIFEYAMKEAGTTAEESIMIGDDPLVDIQGAASVGMDQIFFNHNGVEPGLNPTYEVKQPEPILKILLPEG
jgi:putative hydrolase of the HAD superfamily